ncbi:MAG TPA: protein phosphatase 2C domain-containing protein [Candidatus Hydrogenedentes bacterium]|nr:protein phosphatase 2C domain-containing protein [Candidatus Hydrogenedentota bacterium]
MELDISGHTDIGKKKDRNEDSFGVFRADPPRTALLAEGALAVVADGLGGHGNGDIASKLAVSIVRDILRNPPPDEAAFRTETLADRGFLPLLRGAAERANESIFHTNMEHAGGRRPMGTTLLAGVLAKGGAWIINVGDSRAYHIRDGVVLAKTDDHSWVDEQVRQGLMTAEEAETDKRKNLVTRSIGTHPTVEVDCYHWPLAAGDILILCSDGLVNMVNEREILRIVSQPLTARELAMQLVEAANAAGGRDNITVIVARIDPSAWLQIQAYARAWLNRTTKLYNLVAVGAAAAIAGAAAGWILRGLLR